MPGRPSAGRGRERSLSGLPGGGPLRRIVLVTVILLLCSARAAGAQPSPCDSASNAIEIPVALSVPPGCPGRPQTLLAIGCVPCVRLDGWSQDPATGHIQIQATMDPVRCWTRLRCGPDSLLILLGAHAAGHYTLFLDVAGTIVREDTVLCHVIQPRRVVFDVPRTCDPSPGRLPYVRTIRIGPPAPCDGCPPPPICPHAAIPFHVAGQLPNGCYQFRGIELLPSIAAGPVPQPPTVRIRVAVNDCLGLPCTNAPVPFEGDARLPGLPAGGYSLPLQLAQFSLCDTTGRPDSLFASFQTFVVAERCSLSGEPCFLYGWRTSDTDPQCNARVGAGTPARLVLLVQTDAPLAGLQGRLALDRHELSVTALRPIGPAAGMRLAWHATEDGATFVLFSESGAPIRSSCDSVGCDRSVPVLEVVVAAKRGVPIPEVTHLAVEELLASDGSGHSVMPCPTFARIAPARICAGRSCDFNADGGVDVRDLVLMVHCVLDRTICGADSAGSAFDCNGDGRLDVDDVLCCASVILRGNLPGGAAARPTPEVLVRMGEPTLTAGGLDVPIRVTRADLVGAARLAFRYDATHFDRVRVEMPSPSDDWLQVSEAADGELTIGLIALPNALQRLDLTTGDLDVVIHLGLVAGQSPSPVQLTASEFAGPDGVPLAPGGNSSGSGVRLELSAARPNPFAREAVFDLTASAAADVDLGIFDLSGRRVVTLHHGALSAGAHAFRWDGTRGNGVRAPSGIYFYRAQAGGGATARKLVLVDRP